MQHVSGAPSAQNRPRRGLLATVGVIAALGLLIGVTAIFGGLRRAPHQSITAGPGRAVNLGLFRVVPLDARMAAIHQFVGPPKNAVVVRAHVTDLDKQSRPILSFLEGVAAEPSPGRLVDPDDLDSTGQIGGGKTSEIHPGMPVDVQLTWLLPEGRTLRNVTVVFRQWSYGQSFSTDAFEWTVGKASPVAARITLPVRARAAS